MENERIAKLEEKYNTLEKQMDKIIGVVENIRDNHLHSIESKIDSIERKIAYYVGGGAMLLLIVELIAKFV